MPNCVLLCGQNAPLPKEERDCEEKDKTRGWGKRAGLEKVGGWSLKE